MSMALHEAGVPDRPVSMISSADGHVPSLYENDTVNSPNGLSPDDDSALSEAERALKQAEKERQAIVRKYDLGREPGAQIDPWEDPGFEIYHTTDRYGFIHDTRLPDYQPKDLKLRDVEVQREKKWRKMVIDWKKYENTEKLHKRIYKGIPNSVRGKVWGELLKVPQLQKEQKNKYEEMKTLARKWSPDIRQIDLDVNRTYRDHVSFRDRYGIQQKNLFHVLGAYSMYNQEIGYCQGMSQIAALLLMYMEEEEAFWALSALMADRRYAMHGFFISGFPKLLRFKDYHSKILGKFLPKLKAHLDKHMVDPLIYALKWFFQCFLDRVPFPLTLRLWDIYLLEGECVLTAHAYNILKLHRKTLMKQGMDEILHFLQNRLEKDFEFEDDHVVISLQKCMDELRRAKMLNFGPPPVEEVPKKPFGLYVEPPLSQKLGRRTNFTEAERRIKEDLIRRQDKELMDSLRMQSMKAAENAERRNSHTGSQGSEGPSVDEVSSVGNDNRHRNSMSSVTATSATFSVHSSHTLSQSQQYLAFTRTPPRKRIGSAQSEGSLQHENGVHLPPAGPSTAPPARETNGPAAARGSPFFAAAVGSRNQTRGNDGGSGYRRAAGAPSSSTGGGAREYRDRRAASANPNHASAPAAGNRDFSWSPGPAASAAKLKLDLVNSTAGSRDGGGSSSNGVVENGGGEEEEEEEPASKTPTPKTPRTFPNTPDTVRIYVPYQEAAPSHPPPSATSTPKAQPASFQNGELSAGRRGTGGAVARPVSTSPGHDRRQSRKDFFSPMMADEPSLTVPGPSKSKSKGKPSSSSSSASYNYQMEDPNRVTIRVDPRDSVSWPNSMTSPSPSPDMTNPALSYSAPPYGRGERGRPRVPVRTTEPR